MRVGGVGMPGWGVGLVFNVAYVWRLQCDVCWDATRSQWAAVGATKLRLGYSLQSTESEWAYTTVQQPTAYCKDNLER